MTNQILLTEQALQNRLERGEYNQDPVLFLDDMVAVYVLDEGEVASILADYLKIYWYEGPAKVLEVVKDLHQNGQRQ